MFLCKIDSAAHFFTVGLVKANFILRGVNGFAENKAIIRILHVRIVFYPLWQNSLYMIIYHYKPLIADILIGFLETGKYYSDFDDL